MVMQVAPLFKSPGQAESTSVLAKVPAEAMGFAKLAEG